MALLAPGWDVEVLYGPPASTTRVRQRIFRVMEDDNLRNNIN